MTRSFIWMPEDGQRMWDAAEQRTKDSAPESPSINLTTLTAAEKARVWRWLQRHHPELAAALQDPHVQAIREQFDAQVLIAADHLPPDAHS